MGSYSVKIPDRTVRYIASQLGYGIVFLITLLLLSKLYEWAGEKAFDILVWPVSFAVTTFGVTLYIDMRRDSRMLMICITAFVGTLISSFQHSLSIVLPLQAVLLLAIAVLLGKRDRRMRSGDN